MRSKRRRNNLCWLVGRLWSDAVEDSAAVSILETFPRVTHGLIRFNDAEVPHDDCIPNCFEVVTPAGTSVNSTILAETTSKRQYSSLSRGAHLTTVPSSRLPLQQIAVGTLKIPLDLLIRTQPLELVLGLFTSALSHSNRHIGSTTARDSPNQQGPMNSMT